MFILQIEGYLNLFANVIDNFSHGLAIGGSYIISFRVSHVLIPYCLFISRIILLIDFLILFLYLEVYVQNYIFMYFFIIINKRFFKTFLVLSKNNENINSKTNEVEKYT